tara:strand:- start:510 stop:1952 length:1443 start_codon:yes stop_codon:yes gene_type:complete
METESWVDNFLTPISLGAEDAEMPKMQLYKDISELRIQPDEGTGVGQANRKQFTFTNRNLDIIQNLHEAYIEYTCELNTTAVDTYVTTHTDTNHKAAADAFDNVVTKVLPMSAFWVDGYTFELNDTTVSTQNSGLAKSLNVLNHGVYSAETRQLDYVGMSREGTSPFAVQKEKIPLKKMKLKIPLKFIIPYLKQNKISWGVKTTLKLTKLPDTEITDIFNPLPTGLTAADIRIYDIELVVPYVKLENNKQLSLWNQMYSSVNNRYWLENDYFTSSPYDNTGTESNLIYRIATKGLNSRPRWLLLSAVDPNTANGPAFEPMGFVDKDAEAYEAAVGNSLKLTKLRVKINGIYIDGGDVLEFQNVATTDGDHDKMPFATYGGDYPLAYDNYCKFFGLYDSKRTSPQSFRQWLTSQVYCFDLVNIDAENIFANSGNALIIEVEFSYVAGSNVANSQFKLVANVLYDKQLSITHANNSAVLTLT